MIPIKFTEIPNPRITIASQCYPICFQSKSINNTFLAWWSFVAPHDGCTPYGSHDGCASWRWQLLSLSYLTQDVIYGWREMPMPMLCCLTFSLHFTWEFNSIRSAVLWSYSILYMESFKWAPIWKSQCSMSDFVFLHWSVISLRVAFFKHRSMFHLKNHKQNQKLNFFLFTLYKQMIYM